jgi:hypothetical protein
MTSTSKMGDMFATAYVHTRGINWDSIGVIFGIVVSTAGFTVRTIRGPTTRLAAALEKVATAVDRQDTRATALERDVDYIRGYLDHRAGRPVESDRHTPPDLPTGGAAPE